MSAEALVFISTTKHDNSGESRQNGLESWSQHRNWNKLIRLFFPAKHGA